MEKIKDLMELKESYRLLNNEIKILEIRFAAESKVLTKIKTVKDLDNFEKSYNLLIKGIRDFVRMKLMIKERIISLSAEIKNFKKNEEEDYYKNIEDELEEEIFRQLEEESEEELIRDCEEIEEEYECNYECETCDNPGFGCKID